MKLLIIGMLILCSVFAQAQSDSEIISISLVNQIPDPARAGEIIELRFRVENYGGKEANNLEIELMLEYPFIKIPGEEYIKTIKTLSGYQKGDNGVIIKYKLRIDKDAIKGTNEIKIKQGKKGASVYATETFDIEVSGKEFAQIIHVDKAKLDPGKETGLKFTITNIGNSPLQNLVFSWDVEDGIILPVYSDDTKYIKYIDVGESTDLEYTVMADVNAVAGLYQLNLNLKFEAENGTSKEIKTKAGVFVGGKTDFDVTFSESTAGQTSLSVANIGNNPALSVTVRIPEQESFRVTGSTSSIIGNLDKGDYTIVSFQITRSMVRRTQDEMPSDQEMQRLREQLSNNDLKVLIEYTDTTGVRRRLEKTVPIQFRSVSGDASQNLHAGQSGAYRRQSIWPRLIGSIVILIIVAAGIVFYRRKKSQKKKL